MSERAAERALVKAAELGQLRLVEFYIEKVGANIDYDVEQSEFEKKTALHEAARKGHLDIVNYLLSKCALINGSGRFVECCHSIVYVPSFAKYRTPLLLAVLNGHVQVAKTLINKGACLDPEVAEIGNLLHSAVANDDAKMISLMLQQKFEIDGSNKQGLSPLSLAVKFRALRSLKCLLNNGADYRKSDKFSAYSPMMYAITHLNDIDTYVCLQELLEFIEKKEQRSKLMKYLDETDNSSKQSALHIACSLGKIWTAKLLLNYGANPNVMDGDGLKPCDNIKRLEIGKQTILRFMLQSDDSNYK